VSCQKKKDLGTRLILFVNIVYDVYLGKMYCQENSV
jgi:hypothetical protein